MDWARHLRRILSKLGEDVAFAHGGGASATVRGLFLSPYQTVQMGGEVAIASSNPRFVGMSTDLPSVEKGDKITRGAVEYTVLVVQPDDPSGFVVLELEAP